MPKKRSKKNQERVVSLKASFPWLFAALALGALVRLLYLFSSKTSPFYEPLLLDPEYYHTWALRIVHGDWVGEGVFYGLPLYPYFLGIVYKISQNSLLFVKIIQGALGLVTIFFF